MAAGLFIIHPRDGWIPMVFSDRLPPVRDQKLVSLSQFIRQQTIKTIFQTKGVLPAFPRLTHALALAAAARATPG